MNARLFAAAATLLALVACNDKAPQGSSGVTDSPSASPTATATASPTPSALVTTKTTMLVPVYYMGGTSARPRLYREFRSVRKDDAVIKSAVDAMLHLTPLDTDYRTYWPSETKVNGVSVTGVTATVDLSGEALEVSTSKANEALSVQQIVHTVTAVAPAVRSVRLLFDGQARQTLWGDVSVKQAITRDAQTNVLGPVWVIEPAHHASVSRTFTVTGTASVFEATVSWAVTRPGSTAQLVNGFVNASEGAPGRGDWTAHVTLPAGTTGDVVFTAWESSAEDGSVLFPDSKSYRVH